MISNTGDIINSPDTSSRWVEVWGHDHRYIAAAAQSPGFGTFSVVASFVHSFLVELARLRD